MNPAYTRAPHRRQGVDAHEAHTAALLIDFDNVTMGVRSNLGQEFRTFLDSDIIRGKVSVQRAYADWRRYPQYIVPLSEASIDLIFAPAYGSSKKNATDIRLAIDALELVFTRPEIGTFILLSGDSDFSSLVLKLKEYGKYVIGVGLQESTSDILVQNCDEYYSYNRMSGLTSKEELKTEKHDPWELTSKALAKMVERGDVMRSDRLKQVMVELDAGFDQGAVGFSKFNRFLAEASKRDLVVLQGRENGQYEVAPGAKTEVTAKAKPATQSKKAPRNDSGRKRGGRPSRSARASGSPRRGKKSASAGVAPKAVPTAAKADTKEEMEGALALLGEVVSALYKGSPGVRDSQVKRRILERQRDFDERKLGFGKFSLFLQAAKEANTVSLTQDDAGNLYLSPASPEASQTTAKGTQADDQSQAPEDSSATSDGRRSPLSAAARRVFGRFRGGSRKESEEPEEAGKSGDAEAAAAVSTPEPPASEGKKAVASGKQPQPQPRTGATRPSERRSDEGRDNGRAPKAKAQPQTESDKPAARRSATKDSTADTPSPADTPRADTPRSQERPKARRGANAARRSVSPPRTLGRYRRGSVGGPSTKPKGAEPSQSARAAVPARNARPAKTQNSKAFKPPSSDGAASKGQSAAGDRRGSTRARRRGPRPRSLPKPVRLMVNKYPGVGRQTAETLFERFGDSVFEIIETKPAQLEEVLTPARAQIVVAAHRKVGGGKVGDGKVSDGEGD